MTTTLTCPNCSQQLRLKGASGSVRVTCPSCKKVFLHDAVPSNQTGKDHIPYCWKCDCYVSPNSVNQAGVTLGPIVEVGGMDVLVQKRSNKIVKLCPHCGSIVKSAEERRLDESTEMAGVYGALIIFVGLPVAMIVFTVLMLFIFSLMGYKL